MKKVLLTLLAFLTVGGAWAQKLTVGEIVVLRMGLTLNSVIFR